MSASGLGGGAKVTEKVQKTNSKESRNGRNGVLSLLVLKVASPLSQGSFHQLF
uniref:Uncharacterized protein n=1 Tax=Lepeophtheirus salmonis TaxID=72036 RepID=A0A0K2UZV4_LEPSM